MRRRVAAAVAAVVLLLPLTAQGLALELVTEEGSGSGSEDVLPTNPGLETLEEAGSERKDQLFQSLAELLIQGDDAIQDSGQLEQPLDETEERTDQEESSGAGPVDSESATAASDNTIVVPVRLMGVKVVDPDASVPETKEQEEGEHDAVVSPLLENVPEEDQVNLVLEDDEQEFPPPLVGDNIEEDEDTSTFRDDNAQVTLVVEEEDEQDVVDAATGESDKERQASAEDAENEVPLPERRPVMEPIVVAETAHCIGCVTPILKDSADLRRIANMAAKLLEDRLEARYAFRVTEVYRASKQVVNGIMYFLTLELAETSCERPVPAFTLCYLAKDAPHAIYAVEVLHQPHRANTELLHFREMTPEEVSPHVGLFASATAEPPTMTPAPAAPVIAPGDSLLDILMGLDSVRDHQRPGGNGLSEGVPLVEEQQVRHSTDPAALHVQSLLQDIGWSPQLTSPNRAEDSSLLLVGNGHGDDWMGTSPQDMLEEEPSTSGCRTGRQFDAKQVPLNIAHPRVQKILHGFLDGQERSRNTRLVITDVKSATRQTVAETNYKFEFVLGESDCPKNSTVQRYSCSALANRPFSTCKVSARERAGRPLQYNSVSCNTQWQPRCPGGQCPENVEPVHPYGPAYLAYPESPVQVNTRDSGFLQLLQHVQHEVNRRSRRPVLKKFVETLNATKTTYNLQETSDIVEQELYWLTLRFADTACSHTDPPTCLEEASPDTGAATCVCDVRVSSLSWADRMRVLDMFCESELTDRLQT